MEIIIKRTEIEEILKRELTRRLGVDPKDVQYIVLTSFEDEALQVSKAKVVLSE